MDPRSNQQQQQSGAPTRANGTNGGAPGRDLERRGMLPEGTHRARAQRWGYTETRDGALQVSVELITHSGCAVEWTGSCSLSTDTRSGKSAWEITERSLKAMGWPGDDAINLTLDRTRVVNIAVEHEIFEGKKRAKIVAIWPCAIDAFAAPTSKIAAFAARLAAMRGQAPRGDYEGAGGEGGEDDADDDVPY